MARFFIERPVLANVIAIITVMMGLVAALSLPIEQFPSVTPPTISIRTNYPGANATVVANTVAAPIEQQVNGVENMLYMSSSSSSDGSYTLTVTFEIGTDLDEAQVLVQNRVAIAEPILPEEVRRQGVTVKKQSTSILFVIALVSKNPELDELYLANLANLQLKDELSRVKGVGNVQVFGSATYSMRIWLDAAQLKARNMTAGDVLAALREQNVQVAAGKIGQPPTPDATQFQYTVNVHGRLSTAEQFENVIVKSTNDRQIVKLKDIARVELGSQSYDQFTELKGQPNANLGIYQLPGANALEVAERVKATMEELATRFPPDVTYKIPFDTTSFVDAAVAEVYKTMAEAGILVLLVIMIFLQDWRALLIPATTVPVTIIGAFAAMYVLGFSINTLTLFGLILAIAIVVDDAIVVVENVVHHIERGEQPKTATIRAMGEVLTPIIGITLVLMAVFIPASLLGGITGQLYRQFALTIAATALISAINAVTLKPTQSALWLRPIDPNRKKWFFYRWFNAIYDLFERTYLFFVRRMIDHPIVSALAFIGVAVFTGWLFLRQPTGFFPVEDQGYVIASVQLPDSASLQRTADVFEQVDAILADTPGISNWITIGGLSLMQQSSASNSGTIFISFAPWEERLPKGLTQGRILGMISQKFGQIQEGQVMAFPPPPIRGLGFQGGFQMIVEDRGGVGLEQLERIVDQMVVAARGQSSLTRVNSMFSAGVPQLYVDIDRVKAKKLNIPLGTIFGTLQTYLGSAYVNDFNKFGRVYQVRVQAEAEDRAQVEDIERLQVRTIDGEMIPLGTVVSVRRDYGPSIIKRYNLYPSATISGVAAPGVSSGEALEVMEGLAAEILPDSMGYEWTGLAYQQIRVGNESLYVFGFGVLLIYFVLAAQYESWILPFSVILVVPLGLLGTVLAVMLREFAINIYTQVGILLIIALASKNAILVVSFARDLRLTGESIHDAALGAARMRFRPIIMTSLAFILGVLPLAIAEGAGAASRQALGTAVVGGMITGTVLSVFFVPAFYIVFQNIDEFFRGGPKGHPASDHATMVTPEEPTAEPVGAH